MKKWLLPIIVTVMFATLLMADLARNNSGISRLLLNLITDGTASCSVRTATYNGGYAPRNAGAIWITDSNNQFVKTIKVWANSYRSTLIRWISSSGQNTTGAITGASLNSHQLHNVSWNGKNWQNQSMPDGDYKFNIEFTEHNASPSNLGKFKQLTFTKGTEPVNLTIPNETYFRDMAISWIPLVVKGTLSGTVTSTSGIPVSSAAITVGSQNTTSNAAGAYTLNLDPGIYTLSCTAAGFEAVTANNIQIQPGITTTYNISMGAVANQDDLDFVPAVEFSPLYPNPATSFCTMKFHTPSSKAYSITIYDIKGRAIRIWKAAFAKNGWQELSWDLTDTQGNICPNGRYAVVLKQNGKSYTQRVSVVK